MRKGIKRYISVEEANRLEREAKRARLMLKLKRRNLIAFAERENRAALEQLRKTDPRMKGGRITEVLQLAPSAITELVVYEENGGPSPLST